MVQCLPKIKLGCVSRMPLTEAYLSQIFDCDVVCAVADIAIAGCAITDEDTCPGPTPSPAPIDDNCLSNSSIPNLALPGCALPSAT